MQYKVGIEYNLDDNLKHFLDWKPGAYYCTTLLYEKDGIVCKYNMSDTEQMFGAIVIPDLVADNLITTSVTSTKTKELKCTFEKYNQLSYQKQVTY